ncbi:3-phosphoserine/phosphohydroxythreonine transaminase [Candidatus Fermentibacteria bacterium]|nr:3-phosphoserine/phosphohydroxythreonine transaminase [Candidatus Fermentibacteria bacterium]
MPDRVYNFYPGPATLPFEVVRESFEKGLNYNDLGMSIMEISHRCAPFNQMWERTQEDMLDVMGLSGDEYVVFFLGGGASTQFLMIPYNFLSEGQTADYVNTGRWAVKAIKEAKLFGNVNLAADSEPEDFKHVPREYDLAPDAQYVHVTSNNTVAGTQMFEFPQTGDVPLVSDMSSDFLSRNIDFGKFDLVYAGAQKNIGPAGVTAVVIKKSWIERSKEGIPTMMSYRTHLSKNSVFNTPPVFNTFVVGLVMQWIKRNGGLEGVQQKNDRKAGMIYDAIDGSDGFYSGVVRKDSRSKMNVTFRLPSEGLEKRFVAEAEERDLIGLKGHRSVGGCRASIYNAMPVEGVQALVDFMEDFRKKS